MSNLMLGKCQVNQKYKQTERGKESNQKSKQQSEHGQETWQMYLQMWQELALAQSYTDCF